jgi:hypothetical protein
VRVTAARENKGVPQIHGKRRINVEWSHCLSPPTLSRKVNNKLVLVDISVQIYILHIADLSSATIIL